MPLSLWPERAISRRDAMAIGASALIAGCSAREGSRSRPEGWYALLSDPHIASDPAATLRGEVMADHLRAAVSDILAAGDAPRGVIINGDLAFETGAPGDYATFADVIAPLRQHEIPVHLTLGNHDDRDAMAARLVSGPCDVPGKIVGSVDGANLRFVMLDSQDGVNVTAGRLGEPQMQWLASNLDAHPSTPTVIVVHHHLDANARPALRDTAPLLDVLRPRRQVKAVVFGHTHVWSLRTVDEIAWINLPALGYRFQPKEPLGWLAFRPEPEGAEIELRCVGGGRSLDGLRWPLKWRSS